jgi:hypothetical protein
MEACQAEAANNLNKLIASKQYTWCDVNNNLKNLQVFFSKDTSWASYKWFLTSSWSPRINEGPYIIFTTQQLLFIVVSVLANIFIIFYHFSEPVHPKFTISFLRRVCIRVHVFSGSIGVILPLYIFFTSNQYAGWIGMFIFVAWDIIFAISACIQAPSVYGVRSVTVPLYFVCVGCKFILTACLFQSLFFEPLGGYKSQVCVIIGKPIGYAG